MTIIDLYLHRRLRALRTAALPTGTCHVCDEEKPIDEFHEIAPAQGIYKTPDPMGAEDIYNNTRLMLDSLIQSMVAYPFEAFQADCESGNRPYGARYNNYLWVMFSAVDSSENLMSAARALSGYEVDNINVQLLQDNYNHIINYVCDALVGRNLSGRGSNTYGDTQILICNDCIDKKQCEQCNDYFDEDECHQDQIDNTYICENCYDHDGFSQCEKCGKLDTDDIVFLEGPDSMFCTNCAQDGGYKCDDCGEYRAHASGWANRGGRTVTTEWSPLPSFRYENDADFHLCDKCLEHGDWTWCGQCGCLLNHNNDQVNYDEDAGDVYCADCFRGERQDITNNKESYNVLRDLEDNIPGPDADLEYYKQAYPGVFAPPEGASKKELKM